MQGRLLIKHAVGGRTFLDSSKAGTPFTVTEREGGGWRFEVPMEGAAVEDILQWAEELNLFVFEEQRSPVVKHWYYVEADSVIYDEGARVLLLEAGSKLEYVPDVYTW
jgi:hypothetical protein